MSSVRAATAIAQEVSEQSSSREFVSHDRPMSVCIVSFKECWQDASGTWFTDGGFPMQMASIASLFGGVTLLICHREPKEGGMRLPPEARVVPMPIPPGLDARRKLSVIRTCPRYMSLMRRYIGQADAVHVPLPGDLPLMAMMTAICMRRPLVARYGGSWCTTSRTTMMNRVTRGLMRVFSRGRNVMLATGEGMAPPAAGMDWIFATALSQEEVSGIVPRLDRQLTDPPQLIFAGRLSPEKNVEGILRAIGQLKQDRFAHLPRLTILGGGRLRQQLELCADAEGVSDRVHFAGQVDRTELSRQMQDADLCIQPSFTEGFSKAWLDAMAHGVPVLTCDVGAARGVIGADGQRGWVVSPGDQSQLTSQLREVLSGDVDWPALRKRCRDYAENRTLEVWAERIGGLCARRWGVQLVDGRLVRPS